MVAIEDISAVMATWNGKGNGRSVKCHDWHRRGGRGIAPLMLNLGARWGWVFIATRRPLYSRERALVRVIR